MSPYCSTNKKGRGTNRGYCPLPPIEIIRVRSCTDPVFFDIGYQLINGIPHEKR
jgi:hypothetical protein